MNESYCPHQGIFLIFTLKLHSDSQVKVYHSYKDKTEGVVVKLGQADKRICGEGLTMGTFVAADLSKDS